MLCAILRAKVLRLAADCAAMRRDAPRCAAMRGIVLHRMAILKRLFDNIRCFFVCKNFTASRHKMALSLNINPSQYIEVTGGPVCGTQTSDHQPASLKFPAATQSLLYSADPIQISFPSMVATTTSFAQATDSITEAPAGLSGHGNAKNLCTLTNGGLTCLKGC